jgi:polysaccharide export outer membrane protein
VQLPRELTKVNLPEYQVEPPDILSIDVLYPVPVPPYKLQPFDVLGVRVPNAPETQPINGPFTVDPDGTIDLGGTYTNRKVTVVGLTVQEAATAIKKALDPDLKMPQADVALLDSRSVQPIRGPHLVRPDGTVSLGRYGSVNVTGMTLAQAKQRIDAHLSQFLQNPDAVLDVTAYNSKVVYVIFDGGGTGQQIQRLPITGNETVLDAVAQLGGLPGVADQQRIWVARAGENGCETILPVDWNGVTAYGRANTNYQLLPGDRLFVMAYPLVNVDSTLARVFAPFERVFGFALLTLNVTRFNQVNPGGFGGGGF